MDTANRSIRTITLLVTILGSFMVLLDGSIVLVALPTIQEDLRAQVSDLQWTVDAYTLPFAALMLTAGTLGDRLGRKRVYLTGLVLFLIGSLVCGAAGELSVLILGRVVQGFGAAAINTGSLALLVSTFTQPADRAKAIGIWTAVSGVSLAAGPLVGGLLIESFSWPSIFFINLPIGGLALFLGLRLVESRNPSARRIDLPGQLLVIGGLTALIMALIRGEADGWTDPLIVGLLAAAAVLLLGFLVVESRSSEPLLPLDLFKVPAFSVACLTATLLGFIIVGVMFFGAQYFQAVQGHSALGAGLRLLPLTLGIFFMSPPAARITGRIGPRIPIVWGASLAAVGFLLLTAIEPASSFGSVWWRLGLVGIGIGWMFAPLTVAIMASTPPARAGLGSSMINTFRIVGFTAGAAVLGTFVLARFGDNIAARLAGAGVPTETGQAAADRLAPAGAFAGRVPVPDQLPMSQQDFTGMLQQEWVSAVHGAFVVSALCMIAAAVLGAVFLSRGRPATPPAPGTAAEPRTTALKGAANGTATDAVPTVGAEANGNGANGAGTSTDDPLTIPSSLVDADWLERHLDRRDLKVIDCTVWHEAPAEGGIQLRSGREEWEQGHIPGSVFADLITALADPTARKPFGIPSIDQFTAGMEELGIDDTDCVVIYDQAHTAWATRLWWLLRLNGFENAAVLDGGWTGWTAQGRPVSTEAVTPTRGTFRPRPSLQHLAGPDEVQAATGRSTTCLINALSPEQHAGVVPVANDRRGHIESSVNVPAVSLIDRESGRFRPLDQLRDTFDRVGAIDADDVIVYCAAGVNATSDAFVLHLLGVSGVAIYDGGLVDWTSDPSRQLVVAENA